MNCNQVEVLLADHLDRNLDANTVSAVESHLSECAACRALAQDATLAVAFMERAESIDAAPPELVNRILFDVTSNGGYGLGKLRLSRRLLAGIFGNAWRPVLAPRLVMGMAMTALWLGMMLSFVPTRKLTPAGVWAAAEDQLLRLWDRGVKYSQTVPVVVEAQARYREWEAQREDSGER
jgi:anti-sigma factor RsiW